MYMNAQTEWLNHLKVCAVNIHQFDDEDGVDVKELSRVQIRYINGVLDALLIIFPGKS